MIEVFLARYDVYCESVNMPEIKLFTKFYR